MSRNYSFAIAYSLILFTIFQLTSCQTTIDPQNAKSYLGKPLKLNSYLSELCQGEETVLAYFDLKECFSCQTKELFLWNDFLLALKNSTDKDEINVVFILNIQNNEQSSEFIAYLLEYYPINFVFDPDDLFKNSNLLPRSSQYHCFLLDKKGRIKLIGKPIFNSDLFDKYLLK